MLSLFPKLVRAKMRAKANRLRRSSDDEQIAPVAEKADGSLRLVTLNLAHGRSRSTHQALLRKSTVESNLADVASALQDARPDLVALQEADGPSVWSGNFDHVQALVEATDLAAGFRGDHNALRLGPLALASGTAILARSPFVDTHSHRFGQSWRDTKGFVVASMAVPDWNDLEVDAVSVHLDFLLSSTRSRQVGQLIDVLEARPAGRPLVISGDMNCCWDYERGPLETLAERLDLSLYQPEHSCPTFPAAQPFRRLDWILISRELEFVHHETLDVPLSDHLGVLADVRPR